MSTGAAIAIAPIIIAVANATIATIFFISSSFPPVKLDSLRNRRCEICFEPRTSKIQQALLEPNRIGPPPGSNVHRFSAGNLTQEGNPSTPTSRRAGTRRTRLARPADRRPLRCRPHSADPESHRSAGGSDRGRDHQSSCRPPPRPDRRWRTVGPLDGSTGVEPAVLAARGTELRRGRDHRRPRTARPMNFASHRLP